MVFSSSKIYQTMPDTRYAAMQYSAKNSGKVDVQYIAQ